MGIDNSLGTLKSFKNIKPASCEWEFPSVLPSSTIQDSINNDSLNISVHIKQDPANPKEHFLTAYIPESVVKETNYLPPHDATVYVFENIEETDLSEYQSFNCHKSKLTEASGWFKQVFNDAEGPTTNEAIIRGMDPEIFKRLLQYSYTLTCDIMNIEDALTLIEAAERLEFNNLIKQGFQYLQTNINSSAIWNIWKVADVYDCKKTIEVCKDYLKRNIVSILKDTSWLRTDVDYALRALNVDGLPEAVNEAIFLDATLIWREWHIQEIERKTIYIDSWQYERQEQQEREEIDHKFASMVRCIRFSQMVKEDLRYISNNIQYVMNVEGIPRMIARAFRNIQFDSKETIPKEYQKRHIH
ncbi:hypothetical protein PHYBLDRAFT_145288 [Phycomyces blakesleeanus NRRL 1555(-)]|uniref:BTB domain-containing protein n=1 Tax=Phycomyces blakesleeanus (strain ATCC 8743b / DSM 1359 / FGSC 10004 / NBRC 33097 / NRRL 1555) TaxID=763407 RepID=A0A167MSQ7_PHYB8|nr:hypothetical protein PHYBLDRAFT_145288 [Phycomyces blakesleeanus NRRL 1555(-)]OAD73819.1 hypothetical protein PHYBLDRAFT_145288 [Phycomyces blakesleeanus NRRL 1555(-)]|eukprot:XP_018291859.1 hypothetical protein PHYBLDRAFT_145288 [Phycomyces blakesleeanus NRRL 1555(-)]